MKKILITGVGRSGTTFIMQILTELGYDTGFKDRHHDWRVNVRAGQEMAYPVELAFDDDMNLVWNQNITELKHIFETYPKIIKSPGFSIHLKKLIGDEIIEVEHVIIPIRDVEKSAKSRIAVRLHGWPRVLDGLKSSLSKQRTAHYICLGMLLEALQLYDISHTFIKFPEMVVSTDYLYSKLRIPFPDMEKGEFAKVFDLVSDKKLITIK
jgi:hypothetical protein